MDKKYIAPCGLICIDCLFYKPEIYETAKKLKDIIKNSQLDIFLELITENESWNVIADHLNSSKAETGKNFEVFKKLPDFLKVLDGLIELQCKVPCRDKKGCSMGGVTHKCDALKCLTAKGYDGCWECAESESCDKLSFVRQAYGKTITKNFKTIKEKGIEAVKSHGNKYYAWQRNINS
ncbi:DUF3795 domain-containing protein [Lentisphaerota bacterium ZTH]|nr:DUF3795 domain-containing protein [Lentisphaerota bacterium]WET06077.1 DUF3795 domain-containing protein [Lentisphaerota bacterium ZTH]